MKIRIPQHTQEARQAAEAPDVDLGAQKAAHALPNAFRAAQAPSVSGLAAFMPMASGSMAVPDYDQPMVDLGIVALAGQIDMDWFGVSKVVDEAGGPLLVWHGTTTEFDAFEKTEDGAFHFGDFMTAESRMADVMASKDGDSGSPDVRYVSAHLKIVNPLIIDFDPLYPADWQKVIESAKAAGHDGIRYPNWVEGVLEDGSFPDSWAAFQPDQIQVMQIQAWEDVAAKVDEDHLP